MLVIVTAFTLAAIPGLARLDFDSQVREIFRSASQEYDTYAEVLRLFPGVESDVVVLVRGAITERKALDALLILERALSDTRGVDHVISLLSQPDVEQVLLDPIDLVMPERVDVRQAAAIAELLQEEPRGLAHLIGDQGDLQLLLLRLSPGWQTVEAYGALREHIRQLLGQTLDPADLTFLIAGVPEMETAIREESIRDTTRIIALAITLCTVVAWLLFRSLSILLTMAIGPCLGVVWTLGIMGHRGDDMTVFTTVLVPLLFVIGYTNAAHFIFAILRSAESCGWRRSSRALGEILPACAVAALTTAVGFGSLALSSSPLVSGFGVYSGLGTLLTLLGVIMATPAMAAFLGIAARPPRNSGFWSMLLFHLGHLVTRRSLSILLSAVILIPPAIWLSLQLEADYRIRENFSPASGFHRAITLGDQQLSGLITAHVLVRWKAAEEPDLGTIQAAESRIIEAAGLIAEQRRIAGLSTLLPRGLTAHGMTPRDLDAIVPPGMLDRVLDADSGAALITIPLKDSGAKHHAPRLAAFEDRLGQIDADFPDLTLSLTGLGPMTVQGSRENVREMARSLSMALVLIFLVIVLVLRSLRLGLICMVPNLLPLVGVATLMSLFSIPLQFNTVLVFTICIGIAVDDTVHLVFRYLALRRTLPGGQALRESMAQVGLVLLFTTLVLGVGFFSLVTSQVNVVQLMGALGVTALVLALVADLLLLPALLARMGDGCDRR
jgi:predicted RND superfamily exporter protein